MADLKASTTIGGAVVWNQGNFPLFPAGNKLKFREFTVYTTNDKPQAVDNDFVSKADGGVYLNRVTFNTGVSLKDINGDALDIVPGEGDRAMFVRGTTNLVFVDPSNGTKFTIDLSKGNITAVGKVTGSTVHDDSGRVFSPGNQPKPNQVGLGNVTNDKQVKLAGDEMTGPLTAPQVSSTTTATRPEHLTRLDQVIVKGSIIDFGEY
ncbi:tail fiber protein [Yersinia phage MHG19]|nr:tail fiber protein [Yersinia phage MHG19]